MSLLFLLACGGPPAVSCQLASTRTVDDPSEVPPDADFALDDALTVMIGVFEGTATYPDADPATATLTLAVAGASKQLVYDPPDCGAPYTTHLDIELTTGDGTLDEQVQTDLIVDAPDRAAVVTTIAATGGSVEPPPEYESLLSGLAIVVTFDGTWTGRVDWRAQEIEYNGEEFEIEDEELEVATLAFEANTTR